MAGMGVEFLKKVVFSFRSILFYFQLVFSQSKNSH